MTELPPSGPAGEGRPEPLPLIESPEGDPSPAESGDLSHEATPEAPEASDEILADDREAVGRMADAMAGGLGATALLRTTYEDVRDRARASFNRHAENFLTALRDRQNTVQNTLNTARTNARTRFDNGRTRLNAAHTTARTRVNAAVTNTQQRIHDASMRHFEERQMTATERGRIRTLSSDAQAAKLQGHEARTLEYAHRIANTVEAATERTPRLYRWAAQFGLAPSDTQRRNEVVGRHIEDIRNAPVHIDPDMERVRTAKASGDTRAYRQAYREVMTDLEDRLTHNRLAGVVSAQEAEQILRQARESLNATRLGEASPAALAAREARAQAEAEAAARRQAHRERIEADERQKQAAILKMAQSIPNWVDPDRLVDLKQAIDEAQANTELKEEAKEKLLAEHFGLTPAELAMTPEIPGWVKTHVRNELEKSVKELKSKAFRMRGARKGVIVNNDSMPILEHDNVIHLDNGRDPDPDPEAADSDTEENTLQWQANGIATRVNRDDRIGQPYQAVATLAQEERDRAEEEAETNARRLRTHFGSVAQAQVAQGIRDEREARAATPAGRRRAAAQREADARRRQRSTGSIIGQVTRRIPDTIRHGRPGSRDRAAARLADARDRNNRAA